MNAVPLVVLAPREHPVHSSCLRFGTAEAPVRPSRLASLVTCPMSALMAQLDPDDRSGTAADTGNLVHAAAAGFHNNGNSQEAGLSALEAARDAFPQGDLPKARQIFLAYAGDPENANADVVWCEKQVRLVLAPHPSDPTGQPVVVEGTLDQVRRHADGVLQVWDIKTGSALDPGETILKYMIQQAAYTLAARYTLDPEIRPGGIIYTPGYEKPRGRRHLDLKLDIPRCNMLLSTAVSRVAAIRRGEPEVNPGDACKWCEQKTFGQCSAVWLNLFS